MAAIHMSGEKELTFVEIPMNAGASINQWINDRLDPDGENQPTTTWADPDQHLTYTEIVGENDKTFAFVVCRNPWERFVQFYNYAKTSNDDISVAFRTDNNLSSEAWPEFSWIVENITTLKNTEKVLTPQVTWLDGNIDLIIKFESLQEDFKTVQDIFSCYEPLSDTADSTPVANYKSYYNETTKAMIADIYRDDIERFGYTF
jgi:hypothetical protein